MGLVWCRATNPPNRLTFPQMPREKAPFPGLLTPTAPAPGWARSGGRLGPTGRAERSARSRVPILLSRVSPRRRRERPRSGALARRHALARSASRAAKPRRRHRIAAAGRRSAREGARALAGEIVVTPDHHAIEPRCVRAARSGAQVTVTRRTPRTRRRGHRIAGIRFGAIHASVAHQARRTIEVAPTAVRGAALRGGAVVAEDRRRHPVPRARRKGGRQRFAPDALVPHAD